MNRYLKLIIFVIFLTPVVSLTQDSENEKLQIKISQLEKKAAAAKQELALWRDTQKLLAAAKQHLDNQEIDQASTLVNTVENQLTQSQAQAHSQSNINELIPYYLK